MSQKDKYLDAVINYLKSIHFHYLDTWVKECVDHCISTNPSISLKELQNIVKEQWLLSNLRETKVPCLPPNLVSQHKITLSGVYAVQVESMLDASKSYYSQLQKLVKCDIENVCFTEEAKEKNEQASRCLIFDITDGTQQLKAMEYEPILKIKTNDPQLLPGFKMVIIGPVQCRKGMILLKDENVRVYGGEVDTLSNTHNLKSILIGKLNLNEEDFASNQIFNNKENEIIEVAEKCYPTSQVESYDNSTDLLLSLNDDLLLSLPIEENLMENDYLKAPETNRLELNKKENDVNPPNNSSNHYINEDNSINNVFLTAKKHCLSLEDVSTPSSKKMYYNPPSENITNYFNKIPSQLSEKRPCEIKEVLVNKGQKAVSNVEVCAAQKTTSNLVQPMFPDLSEKNQPHKISFEGRKCLPLCASQIEFTSCYPFVYLKDILLNEIKVSQVFTVKAIVLTLKNKISIKNSKYKLIATISDGSQCIDSEFDSDVLENLLEYSPCEMEAMMKAKEVNSAINSRINEAFKTVQQKFISLNCLMNIKFFPNGEMPVILSLEDVTLRHLKGLQARTL